MEGDLAEIANLLLTDKAQDCLIEFGNFINGEICPSSSKLTLDVVDPASNSVIGRIPRSNGQDVDSAVASAKAAYASWEALGFVARSKLLNKLADLVELNCEALAILESFDTGKPLWLCKQVDIPRAVSNLRFFANCVNYMSEECHQMADAINYTQRSSVGVAGLITPWNLPLYLLTWKLAPALIMGNTVVAKPSELTPMTAHALCNLIKQAEIPNGVVNLISGYGAECGHPICAHEDVDIVSFTGGTATGKSVATTAAPLFKKLSLELGGKNATIVFADCKFETTEDGVLRASFLNQGQICLCGSRIFIERSIYKNFTDALVEKANSLKVGDPRDDKSFMGSLISKQHLEKIEFYVDLAREEGGKILCGGKRPDLAGEFSEGCFYLPTLIADLSPTSRCATEEIFGPVVTLHPFDTEQELLEMHDHVKYGLAGSVWTSDLRKGHVIAQKMYTGMVWVNCWLYRDLRVPFGGVKNSGVGTEGGWKSLETFSREKNICIRY